MTFLCNETTMGTKRCSRCGIVKRLDDFGVDRKQKDGKHRYCKPCSNAVSLARYRANPEPQRAYHRQWNREHAAERAAYDRAYRTAHPEKKAAHKRRHYEANPERYLWIGAKKRAERLGLPFDLRVEDLQIPDVCPVLEIPFEIARGCPGAGSPSVDRIIPELGYVRGNVAVISHRANSLKRDGTIDELRKLLAWLESKGVR